MLSLFLAAAVSIPFSVTNDTATPRHGALVSVGLPLAAGSARDVKQLRVTGYDQLSVPAQLTPLAAWPDGSLRWIHALFLIDLDPAEKKDWTLTSGSSSARLKQPAKARIEDGDAVLAIGSLHYRAGELLGPWTIQPVAGEAFVAAKPEHVELEEPGPVRASVRREGWLMRGGEKTFRYLERYNVVAGQPAARVTLTITAAAGPETLPVKSIFFDIRPGLHNLRTVTLGTAGGAQNVAPGDARRLEQPIVPLHPISDRQHPGWINWRSDVDAIFFGVRSFWQLAPKALDIRAGGSMRCELYSSAAPPLSWTRGRAFTHEFMVWFHWTGESFDEALAELNQPLVAVVQPEAMEATRALGDVPKTVSQEPGSTAPGLLHFGESLDPLAEAQAFARSGQREHWDAMAQAARFQIDNGNANTNALAAYYWLTGDPAAAGFAAQPPTPGAPGAASPRPAPAR